MQILFPLPLDHSEELSILILLFVFPVSVTRIVRNVKFQFRLKPFHLISVGYFFSESH